MIGWIKSFIDKPRSFNEHWRWPHFPPEEVLNRLGFRLLMQKNVLVMDTKLMDKLEELRADIGLPILINHDGMTLRGFRTQEEEKELYKNTKQVEPLLSMHTLGKAADITVKEMRIEELAARAKKIGFTGIGMYDTFVHVDVRTLIGDDKIQTWDNRSKLGK